MIRTSVVPTREVADGPRRLDAFYYAGGGRAARHQLEQAGIRLQRLDEVAKPPYMGLRFARYYVNDRDLGEPFLGPSDIQLADLSRLPLVSKTRTPFIEDLRIRPRWILISRSGVIGNFVYVREDMDGLIGSDDLIRIEPRPGGAPLGYVLTFLRSAAGIAMLQRSTYGAVIQHIEPFHVAEVPIPRLADAVEEAIHGRVETAAARRVDANRKLELADELVRQVAGLPTLFSALHDHAFATGKTATGELKTAPYRLDAYHYIGYAGEVRDWYSKHCPMLSLSEVTARIFEPPIFTRIRAVEGVPYCLGAEVYEAHPRPATRIAWRTANLEDYLLRRDMVVVEDAGQRYGLLGTPAYVGRTLDGCAATNNMVRLVSRTREDAGFLFALLRSEFGIRAIRRLSYGTSLPHILPRQVEDLRVPWPEDEGQRQPVARLVLDAIELRDQANDLEDDAQAMLERALDEATGGAWSRLARQN